MIRIYTKTQHPDKDVDTMLRTYINNIKKQKKGHVNPKYEFIFFNFFFWCETQIDKERKRNTFHSMCAWG